MARTSGRVEILYSVREEGRKWLPAAATTRTAQSIRTWNFALDVISNGGTATWVQCYEEQGGRTAYDVVNVEYDSWNTMGLGLISQQKVHSRYK